MKKKAFILIIILIIALIFIGFFLTSSTYYTVSFDTNGGSKIEDVKVKKNKAISAPEEPTKEGYVFDKWYLNDQEYDFNIPVTEDITLKAKWYEEKKVTISFNSFGGSDIPNVTLKVGEKLENLPIPTKEGYKFIGWYASGKEFDLDTTFTEDIVLVAKWQKVSTSAEKKYYSVKFDNGYGKVNTIEVEKNSKVDKPENLVREGYTFLGWYLNNQKYNFNSKVYKNITLVAKWQKNIEESKIGYKVEPVIDSVVDQAFLFVTYDNVKVAGKVDLVSINNERKTVEIPKEGYMLNMKIIKSVENIVVGDVR